MNLAELCKNEIGFLRKSPTFAMSLGAKELFHSNFLKFLLETDDQALKSTQNNLKKLFFKESIPKHVLVLREKNNFDLIIVDLDAINDNKTKVETIFVEMKLKSTPNKEQLEKYNEKIQEKSISYIVDDFDAIDGDIKSINIKHNSVSYSYYDEDKKKKLIASTTKKYLLSVSDLNDKSDWDFISWQQIAESIQISNDENTTKIVLDYKKSLESVIKILNNAQLLVDRFVGGKINYKAYIEEIDNSWFKKLRLHDLLCKFTSHSLIIKLQENLQINMTDNKFSLDFVNGYTNQTGMINFFIKLKEHEVSKILNLIKKQDVKKKTTISFGVQIQGGDYRHFIDCNNGTDEIRKSIITPLEPINSGFNWINEFERTNKDNNLKKYGRYNFRYTSKNIDFNFEILKSNLEKSINTFIGTGYNQFIKAIQYV